MFTLLYMVLVKLVPVELIMLGICKADVPIFVFIKLFFLARYSA
jgi:hypothetical protein